MGKIERALSLAIKIFLAPEDDPEMQPTREERVFTAFDKMLERQYRPGSKFNLSSLPFEGELLQISGDCSKATEVLTMKRKSKFLLRPHTDNSRVLVIPWGFHDAPQGRVGVISTRRVYTEKHFVLEIKDNVLQIKEVTGFRESDARDWSDNLKRDSTTEDDW